MRLAPAPSGTPGAVDASADNVANPTLLFPSLPTGLSVGDTMLCFTSCRSPTPTVEAQGPGWITLLDVAGANGRLALFAKQVFGSDIGPGIRWSGLTPGTSGTPVQARIAGFKNLDNGDLAAMVEVISSVVDLTPSSNSASGGAITTTTDQDLVLALTTRQDDAFTTFNPPSSPVGYVNVTAAMGTTSGADMAMGWAYLVKDIAGSVSAGTFQVAGGSSVNSSGVVIALKARKVVAESYEDDVLATPGLVGYWRLGEASGNALDSSGHGLAGVVAGGVTRQAAGLLSGDSDAAVRGDGAVGTFISVANNALLNVQKIAFECWVKVETFVTGRVLVRRGASILSLTGTNQYRWVVNDGVNGIVQVSSNNAVKVGVRQHVVGVFAGGTAGMKIYVDGVSVGGTPSPSPGSNLVADTTNPFNMLALDGASTGMQGTLDEVAYYNRALSPSEVLEHYQFGTMVADTPVGSIVLSGSCVSSHTKNYFDVRSGTMALSGTCSDTWQVGGVTIHDDAPIGTLPLAGSCFDDYHAPVATADTPSGTLVLSGTCVARHASRAWGRVLRELPPLRHHIDGIAPNGRHYRWGDDEHDAQNVIMNLRWGSTMPGGHETLDGVLPRKPGVDYGDLERLTTLRVIGAGGKNVGEYRLERTPQTSGEQMAISPSAVGWQAHMDDNKSVSINFIDREIGEWVAANSQRRLAALAGSVDPVDSSTTQGDDGLPSLNIGLQGARSRRANCEAYYFAASGDAISRVKFDYQAAASVNVAGDSNWVGDAYGSVRDGYSGFTQLTPLDWLAAASGSADIDASALALANRRAFMLRLYYAAAGGADNIQYDVFLRNLRVFGDHGLTVYGVGAGKEGFVASDMIAYALRKWAPLLKVAPLPAPGTGGIGGGVAGIPISTDWIQATYFVIPQAKFIDTTVGEIVRQTTRFGLEDWAVWNDKIFYLSQRNGSPLMRRWRARIGPAKLEETGKQADRLWESIVVQYTDVDGSTRTVGPPGSGCDVESPYLKDTDPDNPANKLGITRRDKLVMGTSTVEGAIEVGRRFLEEQKLIDRSGRATLVGFVEDDHGILFPYSEVQAGDVITFVDASDTSYRRIVKADHDDNAKAVTVDLDAPPEGLQAVLERLQVVLVPLGL